MQRYCDLEINILSCLLQKPSLMKELKIEDKYFIKHKRLWLFMKSFYEKFETFDCVLMYQFCKDKFQIMEYLKWLVEVEPSVSNFNYYIDELKKEYEEIKKEKWIRQRIFELANDLLLEKITIGGFKKEVIKTEEKAEKIFEGGDDDVL